MSAEQQGALQTLSAEALRRFVDLKGDGIQAVTNRFYATHGSLYEQFGPRGREACREDLAFHLEFLRPVLEFGQLQPMVDYLLWLDTVLSERAIPSNHLALSLDWLAEFYGSEMEQPDGALVAAALHAARSEFVRSQGTTTPSLLSRDAWAEAPAFEAALLAARADDAHRIVRGRLDDGRSLVDVERHVITPSLYRIGEQWQSNRVTVAQEHLATAIAQAVMIVALQGSPASPLIGRRIVLACIEGNTHALGLQMVADAFQLAGWDIDYLGANVPSGAIIRHVSDRKPDVVGISVSFTQQLRAVKDVIARLSDGLGAARPPIFLGGLAINRFRTLATVVGADQYFAGPAEAVAYASR